MSFEDVLLNEINRCANSFDQEALLTALLNVAVSVSNIDGKISNDETKELKLICDSFDKKVSKNPTKILKGLVQNPPPLDESVQIVKKLTTINPALFESLIEHIATSDGVFCQKEKDFLDHFRMEMGRILAIPVVATMSAGKSTLINALLGRQLLPAKNEACTAIVIKVEDMDGIQTLAGRTVSHDEGVSQWNTVSPEDLSNWNNAKLKSIDIVGDFPDLDSSLTHIVLYDTPGPNNSMNKSHAQITAEILKTNKYGCILVVINAENPGIDDEAILLEQIQGLYHKDDKNIIFVLNKFDSLDIEKESGIESLVNLKNQLIDLGFDQPLIIPTMSSLALDFKIILNSYHKRFDTDFSDRKKRQLSHELIRLNKNYKMYKDIFNAIDLMSHLPDQRLFNHSLTVFVKIRNLFKRKVQIAGKKFTIDEIEKFLILTGIPLLEMVINSFMQKKGNKEFIKC